MNDQSNMPITPAARESVFQNWIRALTRPTEENFASMAASPQARASTGYLWYFIASIVQVVLAALVQGTLLRNYFPQYADQFGNMASPLTTILCGAPIGAVVSTIFFAIGTAIVQWIARMFGGTGTNDKLVYVLSNILTPYLVISGVLALLSSVPYVGLCFSALAFIGGIYILVLEVMAVKAVNRFGWGPAIASLLIPGLLIAFFCACLV
ncbi:MAG TPA: Yip1 family protein, partial [Anaerolineales bacterium]